MSRRIFAALMCVILVLLLAPGPVASADDRLAFISINDLLPPELVNCVVTYGGLIYVPYHVFTNYGLGISYSYFSSAATAYLSSGNKQLFFELNSGDTYDGGDNHYAVSAIVRGGTVYLPLNLMYRFFGGFSYTNIAGNEYGSILRITTDAVVLNDTEFLRAASSAMRDYYFSYQSRLETESPPAPDAPPPEPAPPSASPSGGQEDTRLHEGERLSLSFLGIPPDRILTLLSQNRIRACFFLTGDDIRSDPDMVRRISGEGHGIGIYCTGLEPAAESAETAALLFEAARVRTLLISAPEETAELCRALAEEEGLVWYSCDYSTVEAVPSSPYAVTSWLENAADENPSLLLGCDPDNVQALGQFFPYLSRQKYSVVCPRETDS